jgi:WD40 repeat protein
LAAVLEQAAAEAAVPAALVSSSLQAARLLAAGQTAARTLSVQAITLAEGTVHAMFMTRIKLAAVLLLLVGVLGTGAGLVVQQGVAQPQPVAQAAALDERSSEKPAPAGDARVKRDLFGDPLPPGALARMGTTRFRHRGNVLAFAYAADGKTLISADSDGTVWRWDAVTGKETQRFPLPPGFLAFSPDGSVFASVETDNPKLVKSRALRLWNAATGKEFARLQWRGAVDAWLNVPKVALSPEGKTLALGSYMGDQVLRVWDIASGREVQQIKDRPVQGLEFSPDSRMILARNTRSVLYEVVSGKQIHDIGRNKTTLHAGPKSSAFSPDGKILALGNRYAGDQVVLLDVATGRQLHELKGVYQAAFSRDGKSLAAVGNGRSLEPLKGDRKIVRLNVEEIRTLANHHYGVQALAFAPDGQTVAAAVWDTIRQWDAASGQEICQRPQHTAPIMSVRVAPDSKTVASASRDGTIRLWEAATGREIRKIQWPRDSGRYEAWSVDFSPDGKTLAAAGEDSTIRLWDAATGQETRTLRGHKGPVHSFSVVFSPDGKTLASAADDGTIRLWDAATGQEIRTIQQSADCAVFSPDGKTLASAGSGLQLWEVATGRLIREFQGGPSWASVVFSPDGRSLASATSQTRGANGYVNVVWLWDVATGQQICTFPETRREPADAVYALSYSPDGKAVASGSDDGTIRLWEAATGQEIRRFQADVGPVTSVAFTPDGRAVVSGHENGIVLVWDAAGQRTGFPIPAQPLSPQQQETLWNDLAGANAGNAHQAVWALVAAPAQAIPLLQRRLQPAAPADPQKLARWLADLDSAEFATREQATRELEKLGDAEVPALRKALDDNPPLEPRRRLEQVLGKLAGARPSPELLRGLRAVAVLEYIGTKESQQLLQKLAQGVAGARLTRDAQAALERLARRPVTVP